jgi:hypothetical protein
MAQLPNNATIKDIIAALQQMECISQKADLAATVGSPASASDAVATIITKLQNAKNTLAENLTAKGQIATGSESVQSLADKVGAYNGKRWASGTVNISSAQKNFRTYSSGWTVTSRPYAEVTGLSFLPSIIILYTSGATTDPRYTIYSKNGFGIMSGEKVVGFNVGDVKFTDQGTTSLYVTNGAFLIPAFPGTTPTTMEWIAYE